MKIGGRVGVVKQAPEFYIEGGSTLIGETGVITHVFDDEGEDAVVVHLDLSEVVTEEVVERGCYFHKFELEIIQ